MIAGKNINIITAVIVALALAFTALFTYAPQSLGIAADESEPDYAQKLFDKDEIMTVDVRMDEAQWQDMLDNALTEEYYDCDIVINGETFKNVAIRPKGNSSLSMIAQSDESDRLSFKVEFDHYDSSLNCYGLDKLVLNNNMGDATSMKEYITYDMYDFIGIPSSLYCYARVSVNGEYWGLYLALEGVEDSFLERSYGVSHGELYKPEGMGVGGAGKMNGFDTEQLDNIFAGRKPDEAVDGEVTDDEAANAPPDDTASQGGRPQPPQDGGFDGGKFDGGGNFGGGGFGGSSGGADLAYTDDELSSYETIWEGSVTATGDSDHRRVVNALKGISTGENLEEYMDVDAVLKYLAVHTFTVNLDSLTANMAHNYYLYEKDGRISLIPWDYNLAFGGFSSADAEGAVNLAIDTPVSGISLEDRPIFDKLLAVEEYRELYHSYLDSLVNDYMVNRFPQAVDTVTALIGEDVAADPTAFFTYDEYETAVSVFREFCALRAESIRGQLTGSIPSTTEGQEAEPDTLISASIDLSDMGTQFGGGGERGGRDMSEADFPEGVSGGGAATDGTSAADGDQAPALPDAAQAGAQRPTGSGGSSETAASVDMAKYLPSIIAVAALIAALVFALCYRRRRG